MTESEQDVPQANPIVDAKRKLKTILFGLDDFDPKTGVETVNPALLNPQAIQKETYMAFFDLWTKYGGSKETLDALRLEHPIRDTRIPDKLVIESNGVTLKLFINHRYIGDGRPLENKTRALGIELTRPSTRAKDATETFSIQAPVELDESPVVPHDKEAGLAPIILSRELTVPKNINPLQKLIGLTQQTEISIDLPENYSQRRWKPLVKTEVRTTNKQGLKSLVSTSRDSALSHSFISSQIQSAQIKPPTG